MFKPKLQARTPKSAFLSARSHGYMQPSTKAPVVLPETEECTFKPQLNKKSEDLVNLTARDRREVPIHERLFEEALLRQEERRAEEAFPDEELTFTPLINPQPRRSDLSTDNPLSHHLQLVSEDPEAEGPSRWETLYELDLKKRQDLEEKRRLREEEQSRDENCTFRP